MSELHEVKLADIKKTKKNHFKNAANPTNKIAWLLCVACAKCVVFGENGNVLRWHISLYTHLFLFTFLQRNGIVQEVLKFSSQIVPLFVDYSHVLESLNDCECAVEVSVCVCDGERERIVCACVCGCLWFFADLKWIGIENAQCAWY